MLPDIVNAIFEGLGCLFVLNHCRVLLREKKVAGLSIISTIFFNSWGFWNIFYYWHLSQVYSWSAGVALTIANTFYVALLLKYKNAPSSL